MSPSRALHGLGPIAVLLTFSFFGCAQVKEIMGDSSGPRHPTDLSVALMPINGSGDGSEGELQTKLAARIDGLKLFKSVTPVSWGAPANADLLLTIHQCYANGGPRCDDDRPIVTVSSGRSGKLLYTAHPHAMASAKLGIDPERVAFDVAEAFSPEGPLYALVTAQGKAEGAVPMSPEMRILPSGSSQAEDEGDAATKEGQNAAAFTSYVRALDGVSVADRTELREKLLRLAAKDRSAPDIPQDARRHAVRADTFLKIAQGPSDFRMAVSEYEQAVSIAPWWAEAYRDLGYAQERIGEHKQAMRNLKLYLAAAPGATDAQTVQDRIYALEVLIERGVH